MRWTTRSGRNNKLTTGVEVPGRMEPIRSSGVSATYYDTDVLTTTQNVRNTEGVTAPYSVGKFNVEFVDREEVCYDKK